MIPDGWLGAFMRSHDWHVTADFSIGQSGNLNVTMMQCLGALDDVWLFTGMLTPPYIQLNMCCLQADGRSHDCKSHVQEQIFLLIPRNLFSEDQCFVVSEMSIRGAFYAGTVSQVLRLDGSIRSHAQVLSRAAQVMSYRDPLHERSDPDCQMPASDVRYLESGVHRSPIPVVQSSASSPGPVDLRTTAASDADGFRGHAPSELPAGSFHAVVGDCAVFQVDNVASLVLPRPGLVDLDSVGNPWILAELFAGSFAGWKQASSVMSQFGSKWASTHAVEIDSDLASLYVKNHAIDLTFVEEHVKNLGAGPVVQPTDFRCSIYVGDVCDMTWCKVLPWNSRLVVAMSPPCPPWSPSSDKNGLEHEDGRAFAQVIAQLRYLQPCAVAVENVKGITEHGHFPAIIDLFKWAGFQMAWNRVSDLRVVAPVNRSRWLAVFVPKGKYVRGNPGDLIPMPSTNLSSFGVFVSLPPVHEWELTLGPDLIEIYSDQRFVNRSSAKRKFTTLANDNAVLTTRIRDRSSSLSTIMAHYGAQHLLPTRMLIERGLFAELCSGQFGVRFFSPVELAILHGLIDTFAFPLHGQLGHKAIGNAIATPHAALALASARYLADENATLDPREFALLCLRRRRTAENSVVLVEDGFVVVCPKVPMACPELDLVGTPAETVLDSAATGSAEDCSATLDFTCQVCLHCLFPFDSFDLVIPAGTTLAEALRLHSVHVQSSRDLVPVDTDGRWISPDFVIEDDLSVEFLDLAGPIRKLLLSGASWFILHPNCSTRRTLRLDGYPRPVEGLTVVDVGLESRSLDFYPTRDTFVFLVNGPVVPAFFAPCLVDWSLPVAVNVGELSRFVPLVAVQFDGFYFSARLEAARLCASRYTESVVESLRNVLAAASWTFEAVQDPQHPTAICKILPLEAMSAPAFAVHAALVRGFFQSALAYSDAEHSVKVRLVLNGHLCWDGSVPSGLCVADFVETVQVLLDCLDVGRINWTLGARPLLVDQPFSNLRLIDDHVRLSLVTATPLRLFGGGGKVDTWREVKALLGRELISQGWAVRGLDQITSDWTRRIGQNKLFALLRKDLSPETRWQQLCNLAKEHNVRTTPDESNRLKAAATIQRVLRKKMKFVLPPVETFSLQPGFFLDSGGSPLAILTTVNLQNSGVCLCDWNTAEQWLSKPRPIVSDELGLLALHCHDPTVDTTGAKIVDFPALDQQKRPVILKGFLWQLGEKPVEISAHGGTIQVPDTVVLAITIWRDECSDDQWRDACKALVKTAFSLLPELENKDVVEVWGRCFRDDKKRVPAEQSHSGQFHVRLVSTAVEQALKASKGPVYVTPKDDRLLAHSGWALLWFSEKMEAEIAMTKVSAHSGLARARGRFALRVLSSAADQTIRELKLPPDQTSVLPVTRMYKLQPVPVGVQPARIVEWARALKWPLKVIKMLGRDAVLIGTGI